MKRKYWKLPLVSVFSIFERLSIIENTVIISMTVQCCFKGGSPWELGK